MANGPPVVVILGLLFFHNLIAVANSSFPPVLEENVTIYGTEGKLTTPNFPNDYPNLAQIVYYLQAPPGYFIHLTFYTLRTEECCDRVTVYDSNLKDGAKILKELSGNGTGTVVESSGPSMTVLFSSDLLNTDIGFYAEFTTVLISYKYSASHVCPPAPFTATDSTDYVYGIETSPSWPYAYPNNALCNYWIGVPDGHKIKLTIESFWTEKCCDRLYIYDGIDQRATMLANLSGSYDDLPLHTLHSSSSRLYLQFSTDLINNGPGFSLLFERE
ncbi:unnamed protein product, partial [Mesorhabditis spiculigera]